MTDLILHIGLPKAGSTTIQEQVLKGYPAYLGKVKGGNEKRHLYREFNRKTPPGNISYWERKIGSWAKKVEKWRRKEAPYCDKIIVSNENLMAFDPFEGLYNDYYSESPGVGSFLEGFFWPIAPFIKVLRNGVWPYGEVKVLVVLRNQSDWLGSSYAQQSHIFKGASQEDFEKRVRRLIDKNPCFLDWSLLVRELEMVLNGDNLGIFLMEDMGDEFFWDDFVSFIGLDDFNREKNFKEVVPHHNLRKEKCGGWRIRSLYEERGRGGEALLGHFWAPAHSSKMYYPSKKFFYFLSKKFRRLDNLAKALLDNDERDHKIIMSSDLRCDIEKACKPFNARLANRINRPDIFKLGY